MTCLFGFTINKYSFIQGTEKFNNLYLGKRQKTLFNHCLMSSSLHCCTVTSKHLYVILDHITSHKALFFYGDLYIF